MWISDSLSRHGGPVIWHVNRALGIDERHCEEALLLSARAYAVRGREGDRGEVAQPGLRSPFA